MRPRTLILLLVILPLLAWGAVKGFIWYSLDATFKNVQSRVSHLADISYRELRTTVVGPIGYAGVTVRPKGYDDVINVGAILVHWNEPKEIIPILESFFKKSLPLQLRASANHVSFSLDSDLGDALTRTADWEWESPIRLPRSIWGCGNGPLQVTDYRALEFEHINVNARLNYSLSAATDSLKIFLRLRNSGMTSVSIEGSIPTDGKGMPPPRSIFRRGVKFADLSYTVEDEAYNQKKIAYCSKINGISPSEFIEGQIARISAELEQSNLYPSTELSDAYRSHLADEARITVNLTPFEPFGLDELSRMKPDTFVDWLGVSVLAGNTPISELFVERKSVAEEEEEEEAKQKEETFNPTPFAELGSHLNRLARVTTSDGKTHYAYIENVRADTLVLTRHLVGGSATFELESSEITEVAVLY